MSASESTLRILLAVAARLLPRAARARWREEALADLLATSGRRRWWFAADVVLKVPVLAVAHRAAGGWRPWAGMLAGTGLVAAVVTIVGALVSASVIGEDTAEFWFLFAPCGMLPAVALSAFDRARRRGGGAARWLAATAVTVGAGTGPIPAGLVGLATTGWSTAGFTLVLMTASVPGGWLVLTSVRSFRARNSPIGLAVLGGVAGGSSLAVIAGVWADEMLSGFGAILGLPSVLGLVLFVPSMLVWGLWAGIRLLRGDLVVLTA
ncbi:hypothetical protein [Cryptosporangium minutisporangium]|uniref:Integral membrane protein n=1 Tax=Cryptosporangium minutisporangium TaxID=113569 RepID=A0ABP6TBJ3_9ACTN